MMSESPRTRIARLPIVDSSRPPPSLFNSMANRRWVLPLAGVGRVAPPYAGLLTGRVHVHQVAEVPQRCNRHPVDRVVAAVNPAGHDLVLEKRFAPMGVARSG